MNKLQEILDEYIYITEDMAKCKTAMGINSFRNAIYIFIQKKFPEFAKSIISTEEEVIAEYNSGRRTLRQLYIDRIDNYIHELCDHDFRSVHKVGIKKVMIKCVKCGNKYIDQDLLSLKEKNI